MKYYLIGFNLKILARVTDDLDYQYQDPKTGEWKSSPDVASEIIQGMARAREIDENTAATYMREDTTQS